MNKARGNEAAVGGCRKVAERAGLRQELSHKPSRRPDGFSWGKVAEMLEITCGLARESTQRSSGILPAAGVKHGEQGP